MRKKPEKSFYPSVERWLKKHFACFKTAVNKGLRHGRIDITGVHDVGGDLSGAIETIGIEVKRGSFPFANACGQTLGYNVYVNRVYLADVREEGFTRDEKHIASHLGIGLIQIRRGKCHRFGNVSRENMKRAINEEKGIMFWNREVAQRKHKLKLRLSKDGTTNERRFICPDCVENVLAQFALYDETGA